MLKKNVKCFFIILVLLFTNILLFANTSIKGIHIIKVINISQNRYILNQIKDANDNLLKTNAFIESNIKLKTPNNTYIDLLINNEYIVRINQNTEVSFFNIPDLENKIGILLENGKLLVKNYITQGQSKGLIIVSEEGEDIFFVSTEDTINDNDYLFFVEYNYPYKNFTVSLLKGQMIFYDNRNNMILRLPEKYTLQFNSFLNKGYTFGVVSETKKYNILKFYDGYKYNYSKYYFTTIAEKQRFNSGRLYELFGDVVEEPPIFSISRPEKYSPQQQIDEILVSDFYKDWYESARVTEPVSRVEDPKKEITPRIDIDPVRKREIIPETRPEPISPRPVPDPTPISRPTPPILPELRTVPKPEPEPEKIIDAEPEDDIRGTIVNIVGTVNILRGMTTLPVFLNMRIRNTDVIITGPNSSITLELATGSQAIIGENSSVGVSERKSKVPDIIAEKRKPLTTELALFEGNFLAKVNRQDIIDQEFTISTKDARLGIRGTEFAVSSHKQTEVFVLSGRIYGEDIMTGQHTMIRRNQMAVFSAGAAPQLARMNLMQIQQLKNFSEGVSTSAVQPEGADVPEGFEIAPPAPSSSSGNIIMGDMNTQTLNTILNRRVNIRIILPKEIR